MSSSTRAASITDPSTRVVQEIEQDRQALVDLMERMGTTANPVKRATGWVAEKASRVKFAGIMSGEPDHGAFMALESLTLGVEGKAAMWRALKEVASDHAPLRETNLDELLTRAGAQKTALEGERLAAARQAFSEEPASSLEAAKDGG
jgi:hypothetical protein